MRTNKSRARCVTRARATCHDVVLISFGNTHPVCRICRVYIKGRKALCAALSLHGTCKGGLIHLSASHADQRSYECVNSSQPKSGTFIYVPEPLPGEY